MHRSRLHPGGTAAIARTGADTIQSPSAIKSFVRVCKGENACSHLMKERPMMSVSKQCSARRSFGTLRGRSLKGEHARCDASMLCVDLGDETIPLTPVVSHLHGALAEIIPTKPDDAYSILSV